MNKINFNITAIIVITLSFLASCNWVYDKDLTENTSIVSVKPVITVNGDQVISMKVGGTYDEKGITVDTGDNKNTDEIVSGNVDPNTEGFYLVKYKAVNEYGWTSYAYRSVLVHGDNPYSEEVGCELYAGNFVDGAFQFESEITKVDGLPGYWKISNAWKEQDVEVPLMFADNGQGEFFIVPYEHPKKGYIFGTVEFTSTKVIFKLEVYPINGSAMLEQEHKWNKK